MSLMTIYYIFEVAFGIGLVIFVHELGHFLIARRVGVRVEVFSLGFGPRLFGIRRGPTDYRVSVIPFGGYVKMAGETPSMQDTGAPDEFPSKSVGERALIASGGVLMNLFSGLILFCLAFAFGVKFVLPEVGPITPGFDAYTAGLRTGDRVISVNGKPVSHYHQVGLAIAFSSEDERVTMVVERDGPEGTRQIPISFKPTPNKARGLPELRGLSPQISSVVRKVLSKRAAVNAILASDGTPFPIRKGDMIINVGGEPIPDGDGLAMRRAFYSRPGEEVPVRIRRGFEIVTEIEGEGGSDGPRLRYEGGEEIDLLLRLQMVPHFTIGAYPEELPVVDFEVTEGSPGFGIVKKGDTILRVNGEDARHNSLTMAKLSAMGDPIELVLLRDGEETQVSVRARFYASGWTVGIPIFSPCVLGRVDPGSPAEKAGLKPGDLIRKVDQIEIERWLQLEGYTSSKATRILTVQRGDEIFEVDVEPEEQGQLGYGSAGIVQRLPFFSLRSANLIEATQLGIRGTTDWIGNVFLTMRSIASRRVSAKNLGGPVMIAESSYYFATLGFGTILYFLGIISVNLAVLNILPIPVLDGGMLLFLGVEKVKGSPVSEKYMVIANYLGIVLLLSLMVYVTYNDVLRLLQR